MKLSEAIRLGAMLKPQGFGNYLFVGSSCAFGAAMDAIGQLDMQSSSVLIEKQWPGWLGLNVEHPKLHETWNFEDVVLDLNDELRWTRERIADWVATLEPADPPAGDRALEVTVRIEVPQ